MSDRQDKKAAKKTGRERRKSRGPKSRARLWLFRLIALVVVPVVFFVLLEGGLRIAGYGYDSNFFLKAEGRDEYLTNRRFGWRFFPREIARTPLVHSITRETAPGSYRIFVLGGSAARGHPDPTVSFGRMLQVMLEEAYPGTQFEVINTGVSAINSHTVRLIADDCGEFDPDLFVVYMGNNEVVGPFGPGSVFLGSTANRGAVIRANLWAKSTRIGQLTSAIAQSLRPESEAEEVGYGIEDYSDRTVARDDGRLVNVYEQFQSNLADVCAAAEDAGAATVLCTIGVNLADSAPFSSLHREGLADEQLARWNALFEQINEQMRAGDFASALELARQATTIDDHYADLRFRMGECLQQLGEHEAALAQFQHARELDALRFRADASINEIIRAVAAQGSTGRLRLADCEAALSAHALADHGIPGHGLFYEHVHLTFDGNLAVAATVFREIVPLLPPAIRAGGGADPGPANRDLVAQRLGNSAWDEYRRLGSILSMYRRPPFEYQLDCAERIAELQRQLQTLQPAATPAGFDEAHTRYTSALVHHPEDLDLLRKLAQLEFHRGNLEEAARHANKAITLLPEDPAAHLLLGMTLAKDEQPKKALVQLQASLRLDPESAQASMQLATTLMRLGRAGEAEQACRDALRREPRFVGARQTLAGILVSTGRVVEGMAEYEAILKQDPSVFETRMTLASLLQRNGRADAAVEHYKVLLEQAPEQPAVHNNFGNALRRLGRLDEAIARYRTAIELAPEFVIAHHSLGAALLAAGELNGAIASFEETLRLDPHHQLARKSLANARSQRFATGREE